MNALLYNFGTIHGLEQQVFLNLLMLCAGPLLMLFAILQWSRNKGRKQFSTKRVTILLALGAIVTIIGFVYYRFYS